MGQSRCPSIYYSNATYCLTVPTVSDGFEYWLGKCFIETVIKFSHSRGNQIFIPGHETKVIWMLPKSAFEREEKGHSWMESSSDYFAKKEASQIVSHALLI